jgi:hypothetical protein
MGDEPVPDGWTGLSGGNWFDFALVCTRMADEPFDHPQGVANARLIAAAPDLYEAADALRPLLSLIADGLWEDCPYPDAQRKRIAALVAALSKAREGGGS